MTDKLKGFGYYMVNFSCISWLFCCCKEAETGSRSNLEKFEKASERVSQLFDLQAIFNDIYNILPEGEKHHLWQKNINVDRMLKEKEGGHDVQNKSRSRKLPTDDN